MTKEGWKRACGLRPGPWLVPGQRVSLQITLTKCDRASSTWRAIVLVLRRWKAPSSQNGSGLFDDCCRGRGSTSLHRSLRNTHPPEIVLASSCVAALLLLLLLPGRAGRNRVEHDRSSAGFAAVESPRKDWVPHDHQTILEALRAADLDSSLETAPGRQSRGCGDRRAPGLHERSCPRSCSGSRKRLQIFRTPERTEPEPSAPKDRGNVQLDSRLVRQLKGKRHVARKMGPVSGPGAMHGIAAGGANGRLRSGSPVGRTRSSTSPSSTARP